MEGGDPAAGLQFEFFLKNFEFHCCSFFVFGGYFKKKMTLLKIDFAGGCIAFNIKWYPPAECDAFQRSLRMAKDNAQREEENRSANAMRAAMSAVAMPQQGAPAASGADELMKYASMLEKGLITQEEFNAAKARLLK